MSSTRCDCVGGHRHDAQVEMSASTQSQSAPFSQFVQRNHHHIGRGALHRRGDFGLAGNFPDNLDVRTVRKGRQQQFAHQPRAVGDKDANGLVDILTPGMLCRVFTEEPPSGGSKMDCVEDQRWTKGKD